MRFSVSLILAFALAIAAGTNLECPAAHCEPGDEHCRKHCLAVTECNSYWNCTNSDQYVHGYCINGYGGHVKRLCVDGVWGEIIGECRRCHAEVYENAEWPAADANTVVEGTCIHGCHSSKRPTRLCSADGEWHSHVANSCKKRDERKCEKRERCEERHCRTECHDKFNEERECHHDECREHERECTEKEQECRREHEKECREHERECAEACHEKERECERECHEEDLECKEERERKCREERREHEKECREHERECAEDECCHPPHCGCHEPTCKPTHCKPTCAPCPTHCCPPCPTRCEPPCPTRCAPTHCCPPPPCPTHCEPTHCCPPPHCEPPCHPTSCHPTPAPV